MFKNAIDMNTLMKSVKGYTGVQRGSRNGKMF